MKKEQAHVVYLQDTHLKDNKHEKLKKMGVTNLFFSSCESGQRRGVLEMRDKKGRFILVRGI